MIRCLSLLLCCLLLPVWALAAPTVTPPPEDLYFDQAVLVGDSILRGLHSRQKASQQAGGTMLAGARFLAADGLTLYQASRLNPGGEGVNLSLGGQPISLHEGLRRLKAKEGYIMLGLNDAAGSRMDRHIQWYEKLISQVQDRNPGIMITLLSVTPIRPGAQTKRLTQENLNAFNQQLAVLRAQLGLAYWDVSQALKDEEGYLRSEYCRDRQVHLNEAGYEALLGALRDHARQAMMEGELP